jgi:hypothetical protein
VKGVHWIDLGPWPPGCVVIDNEDSYRRFMRQKCGKDVVVQPYPPKDGGLCQKLDGPRSFILMIVLGPYSDQTELAGTLAHEAAHATRWLFEGVGEKAPGQEAEAYLIEHIVRHGLKALAA